MRKRLEIVGREELDYAGLSWQLPWRFIVTSKVNQAHKSFSEATMRYLIGLVYPQFAFKAAEAAHDKLALQ